MDELPLYWIQIAKEVIVPTNNTYAMLIDVFGKAELVKQSLLWFKHKKSRGAFPDEVIVNTALCLLKDSVSFNVDAEFFENRCTSMLDLSFLDQDFDELAQAFRLMEMFKSSGRVPASRRRSQEAVQKKSERLN